MDVHADLVGTIVCSAYRIYSELARLCEVYRVRAAVIRQGVAVYILYHHDARVLASHVAYHVRGISACGQRVGVVNLAFKLVDVEFVVAAGNLYLVDAVLSFG